MDIFKISLIFILSIDRIYSQNDSSEMLFLKGANFKQAAFGGTDSLESKSNYDSAIYYFSKAIGFNAKKEKYFLERGICYLSPLNYIYILNKYNEEFEEKAYKDFIRALKLNPSSSRVNYWLAILHEIKNNNDSAVYYFSKAIQYDTTKDYNLYLSRAQLYTKMNLLRNAIEDYTTLIEEIRAEGAFYIMRGDLYAKLGEVRLAIADYTYVINNNHEINFPSLFYQKRGRLYYKTKDYNSAIEDFTSILKNKPDDVDVLINRGICFNDIGKYQEAILDFNSALELEPDDYLIYENRGITYFNLKKDKLAIQDWLRAIELNPDRENELREYINEIKY
jgi:tetratricopeptide (TPR) repeat protein